MFLLWTLSIVLWFVFLFLTGMLASSKGHSPLVWTLVAVFLPVIAFIIVLLLPDRTRSVA
jgi:hypothetical protein